jgi:hemerythrin-like domain-containing protein
MTRFADQCHHGKEEERLGELTHEDCLTGLEALIFCKFDQTVT